MIAPLYSTEILRLAVSIPHLGTLAAPDARVKRRSPVCGSHIEVDVGFDGERIGAFAQRIEACALGQASAALMGGIVLGLDEASIVAARDAMTNFLRAGGPAPEGAFSGFEIFAAAREHRGRHGAILLPFEALVEAFAQRRCQQSA